MKFGYKFSRLCGSVYTGGNVLFTPDGNSVLTAVGNRVSVFDLVGNLSTTLPFECSRDVARIVLSPNGLLLLMIDVEGRALLVNLPRKALLNRFNFKAAVCEAKFSPCGKYLAVTHGRQIRVWKTPGGTKEFAPFALHRRYTGHYDDVLCLDWSFDSKFFVTGSRDATCRIYTLNPLPNYRPVSLTAHRDRIVNVFFAKSSMDIYSVSRDGTLLFWHSRWEDYVPPASDAANEEGTEEGSEEDPSDDSSDEDAGEGSDEGSNEDAGDGADGRDDDGSSEDSDVETADAADETTAVTAAPQLPRWSVTAADKHYFLQDHAKVICAVLHKASDILTVGFSNGVFGLYEMPDFNNIHTLSISSKRITAADVNATGEWLAFGCSKAGQLLVWEWQSETYVLKQQGHHNEMSTVAYSPDGQLIATGGDDSKLKVWNNASGFCVVTFSEHAGAITGVVFAQSGLAVLSSSLDGTVRAFDLMRYRNFRTFTCPEPTQFSSLAIDPSGELVCAGCRDSFQVCVWSMKTGRLLEMMAGHVAPVSDIVFNPVRALLASSSWDNTVRLWDVFEKKQTRDVLELGSDVVTLAFRPDGRELITSTLNGNLTMWDVTGPANQLGTIEGRKDIQGGRRTTDRVTAKHADASKCFTSICYSADGTCLLAGGSTKYVCIYEIGQRVLLKRFCVSNNRSLEGTLDTLNSKYMTEAGPLALIDADSESETEDRIDSDLPGVNKGDFSSRRVRREVRTKAVQFAPTGRAWAAASTGGLLIYSLDETLTFDPFDLDMDVTPENIRLTLRRQEYTKALVMSFRLGEQELVHDVIEAVPAADVHLVAETVPLLYVPKLLGAVAQKLEESPHLEFYLQWSRHTLNAHGKHLRNTVSDAKQMATLRALYKSLLKQQEDIGSLCDENKYALQFLVSSIELNVSKDSEMFSVEA